MGKAHPENDHLLSDYRTIDIPRVAVIGCGYWGKNLVRNFAELGALAAVHDTDAALARDFGKRHRVPAATWQQILDDRSIDGVAIAAPAERHADLAAAAIAAGKHVFVEKPLALKTADAEQLVAAADAGGRILMVGHLLQYHPAFLELCRMVQAGELGRLQYLYSNRLNLGKVRREENILWSFAPHDISMILSLVGAEPDRVDAVGGYYLHETIADVTTTHLEFPGGEQAHVYVSWLHPFKEQKLVVVGERGMAVFDDGEPWERKLQSYPHRIDWVDGKPQPSKADAVPVRLDADEPLRLECRHFLDCIRTGERPRTDGAEGLRVLRVLQAAEEAMAARQDKASARETSRKGAHPGVMIHESAYVDEPCEIGAGTRIWHFSHILPRTRIGRDVTIGQNVMIGPDVTVGDRCKIQNNVSLYNGVTLENGVFCGPSCVFTNVNNPRAEIERKDEFRPTRVGRGASIGANATIICGHDIGAYAFIAAGAVVTGDVPAHALMAGVPARRIGWMSHAGEKLGPNLICPRDGRRYRQVAPDKLEEIAP
nr:Gfo/Idh/MocA family oxidoreductase [Candidatus Cybelea sp.]